MINYLEKDEVVENIKDLIKLKEKNVLLCEVKVEQFRDKFKTEDKFEACNHEYWRTCKYMLETQINDLKELLEDITDAKYEELEQLQEAEEQDRDNRHNACCEM